MSKSHRFLNQIHCAKGFFFNFWRFKVTWISQVTYSSGLASVVLRFSIIKEKKFTSYRMKSYLGCIFLNRFRRKNPNNVRATPTMIPTTTAAATYWTGMAVDTSIECLIINANKKVFKKTKSLKWLKTTFQNIAIVLTENSKQTILEHPTSNASLNMSNMKMNLKVREI